MTRGSQRAHITANGTVTPVSVSCSLLQIVISCSNAGTAWTLKIQDKGATVYVIVPVFTLTVPTTGQPILPLAGQVLLPIYMDTGIDIITAGTAAGVVDVWLNYLQA